MLLPPGAEGPDHTHHDAEEAFFVWFKVCLVTGLGVSVVLNLFMVPGYADAISMAFGIALFVAGALWGTGW